MFFINNDGMDIYSNWLVKNLIGLRLIIGCRWLADIGLLKSIFLHGLYFCYLKAEVPF